MIISIKSSASGGSSRGLVHYLAHSKFDREKEGARRREFFTESESDFGVREANRHLSLGEAKPKPEELLHVVIAPSKEEIAKVGETQDARKNALREIVRATVARLERQVNASGLKWVAVAHFNTDNPHAHLAVQKQFLNEKGEAEILRINRQMLHYNERGEDGDKKPHKGALILAAENKVNEIAQTRQQKREIGGISKPEKSIEKSEVRAVNFKELHLSESAKIQNYDERRILAQEMLILSEIRRRERNIENLARHGDKKRFKIKDAATGKTRHVSLFDIEQKIESLSRRKARLAHPTNIEKRVEAAALFAQEERAACEPVIKQLETIRRHVLGFENRHLSDAQAKHARLHNQKLLIEKKHERLKTDVPLPLLTPDEIQRLQTEAVRELNSENTLRLEALRQAGAAELNQPSRRDEDVRELLATRIVSKLKVEAAEKRLLGFAKNKDFIKVKIGDYVRSHDQLRQHELRSGRKNDFWTQAKSKTGALLFRSEEKNTTTEKLDYPVLHKAVADALEHLENTRRDEIESQKEFNQVLDKIFDAETNPNKHRLAPSFSAYELGEAEDLARDAERESFYENSLGLQESWLREKLAEKIGSANLSNDAKASGETVIRQRGASEDKIAAQFDSETKPEDAADKIIGDYVLGRAEARSILARIKVSQAEENLSVYERDKPFIKHRIEDAKTGRMREFSLRDVEPRKHYYLLDSILEKAFESKEQKIQREAVRQAANAKEKELKQNLKASKASASRLENQKTAMLERSAGAPLVLPILTPKETAALDAWRDRTLDKSEADRIGKIIAEAETDNRVGRLHEFLEKTAKELEAIAPNLTNKHESEFSRENDTTGGQRAVVKKQEIASKSAVLDATERAVSKSVESEAAAREKHAAREKGRTR